MLLFILGGFMGVLGLSSVAEVFMRLSLLGWLVGVPQALLEYMRENDKTNESL